MTDNNYASNQGERNQSVNNEILSQSRVDDDLSHHSSDTDNNTRVAISRIPEVPFYVLNRTLRPSPFDFMLEDGSPDLAGIQSHVSQSVRPNYTKTPFWYGTVYTDVIDQQISPLFLTNFSGYDHKLVYGIFASANFDVPDSRYVDKMLDFDMIPMDDEGDIYSDFGDEPIFEYDEPIYGLKDLQINMSYDIPMESNSNLDLSSLADDDIPLKGIKVSVESGVDIYQISKSLLPPLATPEEIARAKLTRTQPKLGKVKSFKEILLASKEELHKYQLIWKSRVWILESRKRRSRKQARSKCAFYLQVYYKKLSIVYRLIRKLGRNVDVFTNTYTGPKIEANMMDYFGIPGKDDIAAVKESVDNLAKEGIKMPDIAKSADKLVNSMDSFIESMKDHKVEVTHKFDWISLAKTKLASSFDWISGLLPEDPETRTYVLSFIVTLLWCCLHHNYGTGTITNKYFLLGQLAITAIAECYADSAVKTMFRFLLFGKLLGEGVNLLTSFLFSFEESEFEPAMETNSYLETSGMGSVFKNVISVFVACWLGKSTGFDIDSILKSCTSFQKLCNGATFTLSAFADAVSQLLNLLASPFGITLFRNAYSDYPSLYSIGEGYSKLQEKITKGTRITKTDFNTYCQLNNSLSEVDNKIPKTPDMNAYRQHVSYLRTIQKSLDARFRLLGIMNDGVRRRPYVVTYIGPSQIGKTAIQDAVIRILMPLIIGDDQMEEYKRDESAFVTTVKPEREYQENYRNGIVAIKVDDMFQMKNINQDPKICHGNWLISVVNNAACEVPKAFGDKGEVFYRPDLITISTNVADLDSVDLSVVMNQPVAYRLGDTFFVDLKSPYKIKYGDSLMNYTLDKSKLSSIDFGVYYFKPHSMVKDDLNHIVPVPAEMQMTNEWHDHMRLITARYFNHVLKEELYLRTMQAVSDNPNVNPFHGMCSSDIISDLVRNPPLFHTRGVVRGVSLNITAYEKIHSVKIEDANPISDYPNVSKLLPAFKASQISIIRKLVLEHPDIMSWIEEDFELNVNWLGSNIEVDDLPTYRETFLKNLLDTVLCLKNFKLKENPMAKLRSTTFEKFNEDPFEVLSKTTVYNRVKSVLKRPFENWRQFMDAEHIEILDLMYKADPEFVDKLIEEKEELVKWWGTTFAGSIGLYFNLLTPSKTDIYTFMHMFKETFRISSTVSRRFGLTMVECYKQLRKHSFKEALNNSFTIIKRSLSKCYEELVDYAKNMAKAYLYGGPVMPFFIGAAIGIIAASLTVIEPLIETNSLLRIKFKPKNKRDVKTSNARPAPPRNEDIQKEENSWFLSKQLQERFIKITDKNLCALIYNDIPVTNIMFVKGTTALVNTHTVVGLNKILSTNPDMIITIKDDRGRDREILWRYVKVVTRPDIDVAMIHFPQKAGFMEYPDILKYFIPESKLEELDGNVPLVMSYSKWNNVKGSQTVHIPVYTTWGPVSYTSDGTIYSYDAFAYIVQGEKGTCVSPLFVADDRMDPYIVGMHSAGNQRGEKLHRGYATRLTYELILDLFGEVGDKAIVQVKATGNCLLSHEVPIKHRIYSKAPEMSQAEFGKFRKTPFYGFYGPLDKQPSILREYVVESDTGETHMKPRYKALDKYVQPAKALNIDLMDIAFSMFQYRFRTAAPDRMCNTVNFSVAINGNKYISPDSRKSSVGYTLRQRGYTKMMMYGAEGERPLDTPVMITLREEHDKIMQQLEQGIPPEFVNTGFGKSELLPNEKVYAGKCRYISGADWHQLIAEKCLFGDLYAKVIQSNIHNGFTTGLNPYSKDWSDTFDLFKTLFCGDGDFGNFDGYIQHILYVYFAHWCDIEYGPENSKARHTLIWRLANSLHFVKMSDGCWIIQWDSSLTSGCYITQLFGSFANNLMIRYNYLMGWTESLGLDHLSYDLSKHQKPHIDILEDNLRIIVLSDDHVIGIHREIFPWNMMNVQKNFIRMGWKYTNADKSDEVDYAWKSIRECQFLKRTWVDVEDMDVIGCPIDITSILGALYWSECNMRGFDQVIDTMLQEIAYHGREIHRDFVYSLLRCAQKVHYKVTSPFLDYDVAIKFVTNTTYAPWGMDFTEI